MHVHTLGRNQINGENTVLFRSTHVRNWWICRFPLYVHTSTTVVALATGSSIGVGVCCSSHPLASRYWRTVVLFFFLSLVNKDPSPYRIITIP